MKHVALIDRFPTIPQPMGSAPASPHAVRRMGTLAGFQDVHLTGSPDPACVSQLAVQACGMGTCVTLWPVTVGAVGSRT